MIHENMEKNYICGFIKRVYIKYTTAINIVFFPEVIIFLVLIELNNKKYKYVKKLTSFSIKYHIK